MSALQARGKKAAICNLISPQIMEHIAFSTFELWNFVRGISLMFTFEKKDWDVMQTESDYSLLSSLHLWL